MKASQIVGVAARNSCAQKLGGGHVRGGALSFFWGTPNSRSEGEEEEGFGNEIVAPGEEEADERRAEEANRFNGLL